MAIYNAHFYLEIALNVIVDTTHELHMVSTQRHIPIYIHTF